MFFVLGVTQTATLAQESKPIVLRFRYWGDFKEIQALQDTIALFEKDHPGVTVHGERVPSGNEYTQKLLIEQAAGLTPDVVFCGGQVAEFAGRGILENLNPYLARDTSVDIKAYYPQLVKLFTFNNSLYALPRDIAPMGLVYYNKSLFDKAGVPYPDGSWSWTTCRIPNAATPIFCPWRKDSPITTSPTAKTIFSATVRGKTRGR